MISSLYSIMIYFDYMTLKNIFTKNNRKKTWTKR